MLSGAVVDVVCIIVVGVVGSVVGVVDDEKEDCSYKINPYLFSVSYCEIKVSENALKWLLMHFGELQKTYEK